MRGGKRRMEGGGGFVPWGGWRGQSRGEGVNRRRRQASFLIKTDHSHQPYQNLVACLHKTTNKNRLLAWPYIRSRPHLTRDYDRLHTPKWGGGEKGGGGGGEQKGASVHDHVGDGTWTITLRCKKKGSLPSSSNQDLTLLSCMKRASGCHC